MALRIGGPKKVAAPIEEEMPMMEEMPTEEEMPVEEEALPVEEEAPIEEPAISGGTLDPVVAGYKDPEMGPFMCGNCQYFQAGNTCQFVSGYIDEMGLCNIFSALPQEEESEELPLEEGLPEEAPVEETPEPELEG